MSLITQVTVYVSEEEVRKAIVKIAEERINDDKKLQSIIIENVFATDFADDGYTVTFDVEEN